MISKNPEFKKLWVLYEDGKINSGFSANPEKDGWFYNKIMNEFIFYKDCVGIRVETPTMSEYKRPSPNYKGSIQYHRLDGPAIIRWERYLPDLFVINSFNYTEEEFWKHPLVQQNKLEAILKGLTTET